MSDRVQQLVALDYLCTLLQHSLGVPRLLLIHLPVQSLLFVTHLL